MMKEINDPLVLMVIDTLDLKYYGVYDNKTNTWHIDEDDYDEVIGKVYNVLRDTEYLLKIVDEHHYKIKSLELDINELKIKENKRLINRIRRLFHGNK